MMKAHDGDVGFGERHPYDSRILHSFGNVPRVRELLQRGKVHVDVGFLDLAGLAAAVDVWQEGEQGGSLAKRALQWRAPACGDAMDCGATGCCSRRQGLHWQGESSNTYF